MEETLLTTPVIKSVHKGIIRMLLYFDIFEYPLTQQELSIAAPGFSAQILHELVELKIVEIHGEYIYLKGKYYTKRITQTSLSPEYFRKASAYSRLIHRFPFVRGVCISGSLSKDWADETSDVDYFIITAPGRLWVSRTTLVLFKKIFLFNSRRYFCVNYFVDEDSLEIQNKNIFTATEVAFLKPVVNESLFHQFIKKNQWIHEYYGGGALKDSARIIQVNESRIKKWMEKLLSGNMGEKLDIWALKMTLKHWRKKFPAMKAEHFDINFKSNRNISKHHPNGFQLKVQDAFEKRIKEFEHAFGCSLS